MKINKQHTIGLLQSACLLAVYIILYNWIFIKYVRQDRFELLASNYMVLILVMVFPVYNLLLRKYESLLGNVVGASLVIGILPPLGILLGGGH